MSSTRDAVRVGLVATSDRASQGVYKDEGIPALEQWLAAALANPIEFEPRLIPDERARIEATLKELADERGCDLVVTTGGTGPAARDVTPEATRAVLQKELPGFGEIMRSQSFAVAPTSILSRATAGTRGRTLIVNLPGNPRAIGECLPLILPAIFEALRHLRGE